MKNVVVNATGNAIAYSSAPGPAKQYIDQNDTTILFYREMTQAALTSITSALIKPINLDAIKYGG